MISESPCLPMQKENTRQARRITWIGLVLNLFLTGLKFIVGLIGSSQAVIADAFHSLSDMITDVAVLLGVKHWSAPPDDNHPYGHLRIEAMVTSFIGIILAVIAFGIGYNAVITVREYHGSAPRLIALIGSVLSIVFKEILFQVTVKVAKHTRSSALIANAWHHRSDAMSSIPVVIAVVLSNINPDLAYVDHLGALIVSIFILKVSWDIVKPAIAELADHGASEEEKRLIHDIALQVPGVEEVHAVRTRRLGPGLFVDLHVLVDPDIPVRQGHNISEEVHLKLLAEGPGIYDSVIHIEPFEETSPGNPA